MIILTAGHTGPNTGAQCATTQFDEGAETIWLRNRVAEILTNKYGLTVLIDNDTASLQLLIQSINNAPTSSPEKQRGPDTPDKRSDPQNPTSTASPQSVQICRAKIANKRGQRSFFSCRAEAISTKLNLAQQESESLNPDGTRSDDFVIDLHFNAHTNPNARGTEAIVANDATKLELRFASRLAHTTSDALDIPLRCIKSESQTPHRRLAMLHLTPQSIILEVCFCTSPEDVEAYRKNREKLAADLAWAITELILDRKT